MSASFWAVLGLLLVLSEFVVPQFVVFFFGLGALLNAFLTLIVPGLAGRLPLQLLIWAATSSVSLALLRRYGAPWFRGETRRPGDDAEDGAGSTAEVIDAITPERPGRIRFRGTTWQAQTFDETIPVGATVTILQKESLTYIVTAGDLLGTASVQDGPTRGHSPRLDDQLHADASPHANDSPRPDDQLRPDASPHADDSPHAGDPPRPDDSPRPDSPPRPDHLKEDS